MVRREIQKQDVMNVQIGHGDVLELRSGRV